MPRIASKHQKLERGEEGLFPRTFKRSKAMPTPLF